MKVNDNTENPKQKKTLKFGKNVGKGISKRKWGIFTIPILFLRSLVSKKKRRFISKGFNLDLTYVTPRVIAMGYPTTGAEAIYRNPLGIY